MNDIFCIRTGIHHLTIYRYPVIPLLAEHSCERFYLRRLNISIAVPIFYVDDTVDY